MAGPATPSPAALKRLWEIGQWARRAPLAHPEDRAVLRELADCADWKTGECYPSMAAVAATTGFSRKFCNHSVTRLIEYGLVDDTGRKVGRTGQVRVLRLVTGKADIEIAKRAPAGTVKREPPVAVLPDQNSNPQGPLNGASPYPVLPDQNSNPQGHGTSKDQPAVTEPPCSASGKGGVKPIEKAKTVADKVMDDILAGRPAKPRPLPKRQPERDIFEDRYAAGIRWPADEDEPW